MHLPQRRAGVDAQLLDEPLAHQAIGVERVGLPAAAVLGEHQLTGQRVRPADGPALPPRSRGSSSPWRPARSRRRCGPAPPQAARPQRMCGHR